VLAVELLAAILRRLLRRRLRAVPRRLLSVRVALAILRTGPVRRAPVLVVPHLPTAVLIPPVNIAVAVGVDVVIPALRRLWSLGALPTR
jgi:hypothetical protein